MRRYESVFVINADLTDEEIQATIDKFTGIISSQGGTLINLEDWGRRRLAYKIKKFTRGYYVLTDFAGQPAAVTELERNYKLDDRIIRFLTTKISDQVDVEALQAELAAKAEVAVKEELPPPETEEPAVVEEAESAQETYESEA
jgi:small subunit ribosomal protein S6